MSDRAPRWEPGRNPVHRLLQCLDVLAVAFNRFRQCSFRLPAALEGVDVDPDAAAAYSDGLERLRADFDAVRDALCRPGEWATPARFAERLADEAVAAFARRGATSDDTRRAVAGVAEWLGYVLTAWNVGAARPWNYYVAAAELGDRRPGSRFDTEGLLLREYAASRRTLLAALATAGEIVPADIDRRAALAFHPWPAGNPDPVSQDELLALARATEPEPENPSPPPRTQPASHTARPTLAERVDAQVSGLKTVPPPGLDPELAAAYTAVAVAVRECARLQGMLPALWSDAATYRRLAAAIHGAADAAQAAYDRVDLRLRRAGSHHVTLAVLNDVLTVRGRAPLDPADRRGGLNAIVTRFFASAEEMFPTVDGRGVLDRMLDELARVPPAPGGDGSTPVGTGATTGETSAHAGGGVSRPPGAGGGKGRGRPKLAKSNSPSGKARHSLYLVIRAEMAKDRELRTAGDLLAHFRQPQWKDFRTTLTTVVGDTMGELFFRAALKWLGENRNA